MKRGEMKAEELTFKNDLFDRGGSAAFDRTILLLVGVGALGLRYELAIALWVTILVAAVVRLRARQVEPLPHALLVRSTVNQPPRSRTR